MNDAFRFLDQELEVIDEAEKATPAFCMKVAFAVDHDPDLGHRLQHRDQAGFGLQKSPTVDQWLNELGRIGTEGADAVR